MIKKVIIAVVVLVGTYFVLVTILPEKYTIERSITIDAPDWRIYNLVGDFRNWDQWNMDFYHDTTIIADYSEKSTGVGSWMIWEGEHSGNGKYEIYKCLYKEYVYYYSYAEGKSYPLKGEFSIRKAQDTNKLMWKLTCTLNTYNLFTYLGFFINDILDAGIEDGLENIKYISEN